MLIHLVIISISCGFSIAYDVDVAALYQSAASYIAAEHITICGQFFVGAVFFVFLGLIMEHLGAYSLMLLLSRQLMELSLLVITATSLGTLFFAVALQKNLWSDALSVAMVPWLGLGTAMIILYLFDFNYPFARRLLPVLFLFAISIGLVGLGVI